MAFFAVNKDGTELVSEYQMFRNGYVRRYKDCKDYTKCKYCFARLDCKTAEDGRKYRLVLRPEPPREVENLDDFFCWDNYEYDPDGNKQDFTVALPPGSIEKITGKKLTWEDDPLEINW